MRMRAYVPLLASLASGPVFLLAFAAMSLFDQLPGPVTVSGDDARLFAALLMVSAMVSGVVAVLPAVLATLLLAALGERWEPARETALWLVAGALLGSLFGLAAGGGDAPLPAQLLPWIAAGAATAWLCRRGVAWD